MPLLADSHTIASGGVSQNPMGTLALNTLGSLGTPPTCPSAMPMSFCVPICNAVGPLRQSTGWAWAMPCFGNNLWSGTTPACRPEILSSFCHSESERFRKRARPRHSMDDALARDVHERVAQEHTTERVVEAAETTRQSTNLNCRSALLQHAICNPVGQLTR